MSRGYHAKVRLVGPPVRHSKVKDGLTSTQSSRFQHERSALEKIQLHFEFKQSLMHRIRIAAADVDLSYSDYVRKVVGLSYGKIQRPRISLSFGKDDLQHLAVRYGESVVDPNILRQRVMDEVNEYLVGHKSGDALPDS